MKIQVICQDCKWNSENDLSSVTAIAGNTGSLVISHIIREPKHSVLIRMTKE